jgi:hypothetical protein
MWRWSGSARRGERARTWRGASTSCCSPRRARWARPARRPGLWRGCGADPEPPVDAPQEDPDTDLPDADQPPAAAGGHAEGQRPQRRPRTIDGLHPREFYARQLMQPEWMTDIPEDLGTSW